MPQMSPIWWSTLFCMFILTYLFMMMLMYFFTTYNIFSDKNSKIISKNILNWKW